MRYVTDNDWKTCKAMVGNLLDYSIEVEDTGVANFEFTDGSHGFFMGTNAYYGNDSIELQVMTDKGRYIIKEDILFDEDLTPLAENERVPGTKIYYGPSHRRYFESFYEAIRTNNDEGYCHLGDALVTMEMIDAIKASSKKNDEVMKGNLSMTKIGVQAMMLKDKFEEIGAFETLKKSASWVTTP